MVRRVGAWLTDLAFPPTCPLTQERVDAAGHIAPEAWAKLRFLTPPWCARCGYPFPYAMGEGALCAPCQSRRSPFDFVRAPLAYDDASKPMILAMKHAGQLDALPSFAGWMTQALQDIDCGDAVIAPVPLHPKRLRQRRFNQAALLAEALARATQLPWDAALLRRTRATPSQGGLSAQQRARNVTGAFATSPNARDTLQDRAVILVDDVFTTGATVAACARVLKRAGAQTVAVAALARVVRAHSTSM